MKPKTQAALLRVPIENDYKMTLFFKNPTNQFFYFWNKKIGDQYVFEDIMYQRKDHYISVPANYEDVKSCNYVMYQNAEYSNMWYYAFVTDIKYINDETTHIYIETDCMQTWMFDYTVRPSFVDREHVKNDSFGANTIPENFELGEFVVNKVDKKLYTDCYAIVASNYNPKTDKRYSGITMHNGAMTGVQWFAFDMTFDFSEEEQERFYSEMEAMSKFITECTKDGQADNIQAIFAVPKSVIGTENVNADRTVKGTTWFYSSGSADSFEVQRPEKLAGYTPKNNKLLCYPFCYLMGSNNAGATNVYKFEDFYYLDDGEASELNQNMNFPRSCAFSILQVPSVGCSIKIQPNQYKGTKGLTDTSFVDEGFMCAKFPTFSWSTDAYTNWMTQNSVNIASSIATSGFSALSAVGTGAATGGAPGALMGGISGISGMFNATFDAVKAVHNATFTPNIAQGNVNGGDVNFSAGEIGFYFYTMTVKPEYARTIDEFFNLYGYKVNRVKIPESNHRRYYWYTKTIGVNIDGNIPNKDLQIIKNCYDNGITFWRGEEANATFGDYTVSNDIVNQE